MGAQPLHTVWFLECIGVISATERKRSSLDAHSWQRFDGQRLDFLPPTTAPPDLGRLAGCDEETAVARELATRDPIGGSNVQGQQ